MNDLIKFKNGSSDVPTLQEAEPAFRKDEKALYIGTNDGNVRLCGANDIKGLKDYIDNLVAEINTRIDALAGTQEGESDG